MATTFHAHIMMPFLTSFLTGSEDFPFHTISRTGIFCIPEFQSDIHFVQSLGWGVCPHHCCQWDILKIAEFWQCSRGAQATTFTNIIHLLSMHYETFHTDKGQLVQTLPRQQQLCGHLSPLHPVVQVKLHHSRNNSFQKIGQGWLSMRHWYHNENKRWMVD